MLEAPLPTCYLTAALKAVELKLYKASLTMLVFELYCNTQLRLWTERKMVGFENQVDSAAVALVVWRH